MPNLPSIPEYITVHLGAPDSNAPNVTLPFADYVANVASSEVYPSWNENALRANIYIIVFRTVISLSAHQTRFGNENALRAVFENHFGK